MSKTTSLAARPVVLCTALTTAAAAWLLSCVPAEQPAQPPPTAKLASQVPAEPEAEPANPPEVAPAHPTKGEDRETKWVSLFDGKGLDGWTPTLFGGEGEVSVEDGRLILAMGNDLTGVTTTREELPRSNYEVELEAMRVDGSDFFCGLTFPVKKDSCSLILGGWGGGVCGLSSIDHMDASENNTTTYREFENGRWYRVRLRVTDDKIEAWIDDEPIVEQEITDRRVGIRIEVELSKPFGLASWRTTAALRNIRLRQLPEEAASAQE